MWHRDLLRRADRPGEGSFASQNQFDLIRGAVATRTKLKPKFNGCDNKFALRLICQVATEQKKPPSELPAIIIDSGGFAPRTLSIIRHPRGVGFTPLSNNFSLNTPSGDTPSPWRVPRERWPPHCGKQQFSIPPQHKKERLPSKPLFSLCAQALEISYLVSPYLVS